MGWVILPLQDGELKPCGQLKALANAIFRECHSSTGNFYRIVSDSAKYCNEHMSFGSDFASF
jgi:hypothetical protein